MLIITEGIQTIVRREVMCALHASLSTLLCALCLLVYFSSLLVSTTLGRSDAE